jgi:RNA recognition motif-containing protein
VIVKVLGQGCVTDLRLSLDENMRPRGFGYVELKDESMVDRAIEELSGMEIGKISRTVNTNHSSKCFCLS